MTKRMKKKRIAKLKEQLKRGFTGFLAVYMLLTSLMVFTPTTQTFALTGGPSQPEVQSFEPIGTSDMVDLFSGDMTYNIPLLDVEGYPINLSYHSGITMDQEASWVGLGWNVNVGTINRGLRGLPDDFDGVNDKITTQTNMKPNRTVTLGSGLSGELFGWEGGSLGFSTDLGISYNNYNGIGLSFGAGLNVSMLDGRLSGGLGISSSSDNGLSISPSVSLSSKLGESESKNKLTTKIGTSFNSRGGVKSLSINSSISSSSTDSKTIKSGKNKGKSTSVSSGVSGGTGSSFNMGHQTYVPSNGINMNSFSISGRFKLGLEVFGFDGGVSVDASYASQWIANSSKNNISPAYGYFNSEKGQNNPNALLDFNREKDGTVSLETPALPLTNFTYDVFSVSGQGVGGSYRGFRSDIGYVFDPQSGSTSTSADLSAELSPGNTVHVGADVGVVVSNSKTKQWNQMNQAAPKLKFKTSKPYSDYEPYYLREANEMSVNSDPSFMAKVGGDKAANFKLDKSILFNTKLTNELNVQGGTNVNFNDNYRTKRDKRNSVIQMLTINQVKAGMGMQGNEPISNKLLCSFTPAAHGNHVGEIISLGTDGMRYVYGLPAYNTLQEEVTFAVGQKTGGDKLSSFPKLCNRHHRIIHPGDNSLNNQWGIDNYFQKKGNPCLCTLFPTNSGGK
jgi:hypothetical protein